VVVADVRNRHHRGELHDETKAGRGNLRDLSMAFSPLPEEHDDHWYQKPIVMGRALWQFYSWY